MSGLIRSFKWLIRPRWVSLNASSISVEETKTYQLIATITPSWVKNNKLKWVSSNLSVATVDDTWLVTAISAGSTTITVTTDDRWFTDSCSCTIWVTPITNFQLNKSTTSITYWDTEQLSVTITPNDATYQWITWSSSNTSVATVDENWLVTPVWEWNCTITATSNDWIHSANCSVTVNLIHVTWVSLNKNNVTVNVWTQEQLTATITPSNANIKTVTWSSSDTWVAVVDDTWLVTHVSDWNCTITATTVDWWYTAICAVKCISFTPVDRCFWYTWWQQSITLEPYTYCIEVWWAQGWNYNSSYCWWYGWYAAWTINLTSNTTLYIYVWWQPATITSWTSPGWYNGWWTWTYTYYRWTSAYPQWWWGGTDVRYNWNTLYHRFIVAGWWAGWNYWSYSTINMSTVWAGWWDCWCSPCWAAYVWCQTAAGCRWSFWQWWNWWTATNYKHQWSWGWWWWYGWWSSWNYSDSSSWYHCQVGWWSWYTYTSSTCWNHPNKACLWDLPLMTNAKCCPGSWAIPTPSWWSQTGWRGNGCVRIRSL